MGLKATETEHLAWKDAAARAGTSFNSWAREALSDRALGVAAAAGRDEELADAITRLLAVYMVRDPAAIVRMAVMAALAREGRAPGTGLVAVPAVSSAAEPAAPDPPASRGRGRSGK